jgi:hypothetical protein
MLTLNNNNNIYIYIIYMKKSTKRSSTKRSSTIKRIFLRSKKHFRGGRGPHTQELNHDANYPAVYGIDDKSVLYPISKYGVPAGFFDPPVNSNGPYGNGPINGPYLGVGGKRSSKTKRSSSKRSSTKRSSSKRSSSKRSGKTKRSSKTKRTGKKRSSSKRSSNKTNRYRGGGNPSTLLPQTIVNAGRGLMESVYETANGFTGHTNASDLNPMPYKQPIDADVKYLRTNFPNVAQNYNKADSYVSSI